ncbi:hypothetical protein Smp_168740 [Schistosoma mansoni]|nr:hypothetical protein Smp_168740 [Schistosoma mansoni]|eukprot:XP_018653078.1 hypothetical protein Smp_168740 [Schistosoma mansoni]
MTVLRHHLRGGWMEGPKRYGLLVTKVIRWRAKLLYTTIGQRTTFYLN